MFEYAKKLQSIEHWEAERAARKKVAARAEIHQTLLALMGKL